MGKRPVWFWLFTAFVIVVGLIIEIRPLHERVWGWTMDLYTFAKVNIAALLTAFFLVKGKFILKVFVKKVLFLSATGLGKRYLVERVFTYHFKIHFLDHIALDLKRLFAHIKKNFMRFPLTKKIVAGFVFLGSLGYVGKFMGTMLALKVFLAKVWSFLLAVVMKAGASILYFFTEYLWGSWLAPILEVLIFSWLLALLEKVPFLTKSVQWLYRSIRSLFVWLETSVGRLFHYPIRRSLQWLLKKTRLLIYRFIGYKKLPAYRQLRELRALEPNMQQRLKAKRKKRAEGKRERVSRYERLRKERMRRRA